MAAFELIVAAHAVSSKDPDGEDRVRTFGRGPGPTGVVVCDGVGSIPGSAAVAEEAAELGAALLSGREVGPAIWNLDRRLVRNLPAGAGGATTMVVVCAEPNGVVGHLLMGNGAVLEIVPMEAGPGKVRLLWTSLALPQMANHEGRPALRAFLPPEDGAAEAEKGIRKVPFEAPRLYLACSDGFLSEEEMLEGPAPDGTVWQQVPAAMARLLELLTPEWGNLIEAARDDAAQRLADAIASAIAGPGEGPAILDDDTTVAALLMRPLEGDAEGRMEP
jgi:hypothetical protein